MYGIAEDLLTNFGVSGKECLLRTICEVQAHPLKNFGFLGEVMKLFFTYVLFLATLTTDWLSTSLYE